MGIAALSSLEDGTFQAQYVSDMLNKAKDIDVQESNKKDLHPHSFK